MSESNGLTSQSQKLLKLVLSISSNTECGWQKWQSS